MTTEQDVDLVDVPDQLRPHGVQVAISDVGLKRIVDEFEAGVDDLVDRIDHVWLGDRAFGDRLRELAERPVPIRTGQLR